jgi:hypothetical protein
MMLLPISAMAQSVEFKEIMTEYSTKEDCTTIHISNALFETMNVSINANDMHVISVENKELIPQFRKQMTSVVAPLTVMMSVNSGDESVNIYHRSENNCIKELVIITQEEDTCVVVYITGDNLEVNHIDSLTNMF